MDFSRYSKSNILVTEMLSSTPKHWRQQMSIFEQTYRNKYTKSLKSVSKQAYHLHFLYHQSLPPKDWSEVPKGHLRKGFYRPWGIVHLNEASWIKNLLQINWQKVIMGLFFWFPWRTSYSLIIACFSHYVPRQRQSKLQKAALSSVLWLKR